MKLVFDDLTKIDTAIDLNKIRESSETYRLAMRPGRHIYNTVRDFLLDPSRHHLVWALHELQWCKIDK